MSRRENRPHYREDGLLPYHEVLELREISSTTANYVAERPRGEIITRRADIYIWTVYLEVKGVEE